MTFTTTHQFAVVPCAGDDLFYPIVQEKGRYYLLKPRPIVGYEVSEFLGTEPIVIGQMLEYYDYVIGRGGAFWSPNGDMLNCAQDAVDALNKGRGWTPMVELEGD